MIPVFLLCMKWFKHLANSTSDPDLMESEVRFKSAGPYVFWRVVEILAREDALDGPLIMNFKVFRSWFPSVSVNKLREILQYFGEKERITGKRDGENIIIHCPKLLEISSGYALKLRRKSEQ